MSGKNNTVEIIVKDMFNIMHSRLKTTLEKGDIRLNTSNLREGTYFVEITTKEYKCILPFIKLR